MLTRIVALLLVLLVVAARAQEFDEGHQQMKRFFQWEAAKRSAPATEDFEGQKPKRKFYQWAGKRSLPLAPMPYYWKNRQAFRPAAGDE